VERRVPPRRSGTLTARESRERQLGRFDRDLLAFWLSWAPYGGPPADECFVEFGMDIERARECCMQVVCTAHAAEYPDTEQALLLRASRLLLGHPTRPAPLPVVRNPPNAVPRRRLAAVR
jgi:hypothetical protein